MKHSLPVPILAAGVLAVGIVSAAFVAGQAARDLKMMSRAVTVRGLAERDVPADLAVWTLKFKSTGENLQATQDAQARQHEKLVAFLAMQGFKPEDIRALGSRVFDRQAQEYGGNNIGMERYVLEGGLQIRTADVALVQTVSQKTGELIAQGVTLAGDSSCSNIPSYLFTGLNTVKPEMMAEATRNAREAAQQFATDAGAEVGTIRSATQGYFSISARDNAEGQGSGSDCGDAASPDKRVRVVTTVEYYLT